MRDRLMRDVPELHHRYEGAAPYYARGRLPYPAGLADDVQRALGLDRQGRLLDLGCGPGSATLLLAPLFEQTIGVDADADMIAQASAAGTAAGLTNVAWVTARAESLPHDLGRFRVILFAQSFHWMEPAQVAEAARRLVEPGGAVVFVYSWSLSGDPADTSPHPVPPYDAMKELIGRYLGRPSGGGFAAKMHAQDETDVLSHAGFVGPQRVNVAGGEVVTSSIQDIIARYLSVSGSSPGAFGESLAAFVGEAETLLHRASPSGQFTERLRDTLVTIWRPPTAGKRVR
jgi:SAM-dependent methyltransferase